MMVYYGLLINCIIHWLIFDCRQEKEEIITIEDESTSVQPGNSWVYDDCMVIR